MKAIVVLLALVLSAGSAGAAFDPFKATGIDHRADARVPLDLAFQDETGRAVTLRQLANGKPVLFVPVVHRCPNICGLTLAGIAEAVQIQKFVAGRDFTLVAFGIDPREGMGEASASIGELRKAFPALAGGIHAVTGKPADIDAVLKSLGYRVAWDNDLNQYAHIAAVAVLTADGRLSHWLYGITPDPKDVRLALTEAGQGKIGSWGDQLLLLCYHYDAQAGRYGSVIWLLLRLAGAATAISGTGWIGLALWRERRKGREVTR
jgi:protein SCO1/2